jgi:hypothetical protein
MMPVIPRVVSFFSRLVVIDELEKLQKLKE